MLWINRPLPSADVRIHVIFQEYGLKCSLLPLYDFGEVCWFPGPIPHHGNPSCERAALVKTHHVSCIIKIHCLKIHWIIKISTAGNWKICTAGWLYAEQVSGHSSFMGSKSVQIFGAGAGVGDGRGTRQGKDCCPLAAFALCGRDVCVLGVIGYFRNMSDSLLGEGETSVVTPCDALRDDRLLHLLVTLSLSLLFS